jgi:hypothetical protein
MMMNNKLFALLSLVLWVMHQQIQIAQSAELSFYVRDAWSGTSTGIHAFEIACDARISDIYELVQKELQIAVASSFDLYLGDQSLLDAKQTSALISDSGMTMESTLVLQHIKRKNHKQVLHSLFEHMPSIVAARPNWQWSTQTQNQTETDGS